MQPVKLYSLGEDFDKNLLFNELSNVYPSLDQERVTVSEYGYYDTFDWRLFESGYFLKMNKTELFFEDFKKTKELKLDIKTIPKFYNEFPDELKDLAKKLIYPRAIIKLFHIKERKTAYFVLNKYQKRVLCFEEISYYVREKTKYILLDTVIKIIPMRGYVKHLDSLVTILSKFEFKEPNDVFKTSLGILNKSTKSYLSKPKIEFESNITSADGTKEILKYLLKVVEQNEAGVKADIDIEFLHDFRVAIRKMRSLLSQMKCIFSEELTTHLKSELSYLGEITNNCRDLDVYILKIDDYSKELFNDFGNSLDYLKSFLEKEKTKEHKLLVKKLNEQRYKDVIKDLNNFVESNLIGLELGKNGSKKLDSFVKKRLYKLSDKLITNGSIIDTNSPPQDLHSLRIDCKKFRYMMEFFVLLFDNDKISKLISSLKKLQEVLGDYQDFEVQQNRLENFLEELLKKSKVPTQTIISIGALIYHLGIKQQVARDSFYAKFDQFNSDENRFLIEELFQIKESSESICSL